ncbi:MAG: SH3 domain-containing protein [Clostridia bacterium]|nr:SH3 domain-containing protein [Clostridia bacterium]
MKKILAAVLVLCLMATLAVPALAYTAWGTSIMYVKTDNGKSVNVRSSPNLGDNVIGSAPYGHDVLVDWSYAGNDGWTRVVWGSMGDGYIMSRYLVDYKPGPYTPSKEEQEKADAKAEQQKLEKELASEKAVAAPFYIAARPSRPTGWVNFRTGPSTIASRIRTLDQGKELLVIAETTNWYKAQDAETGKTGYISKQYVTKLNKTYITEIKKIDEKQKLGTLTVNGAFELTCKLADGYSLQVVNVRGDKIIASVLPNDMIRPQMYLSIAYDETYGTVARMNDLSDEELAVLEETFKDMNEVAISYGETGLGTKLLIAKEIGSDTDFVDILAIYQGYFIEFNMTPNPKAASQTLTEEQIQMCIDFLTDLDFVPVQ